MLAQNDDNSQSIENLIDSWIEQENKGSQFPVPFDLAWQFAGYSKKANAKQSGLRGLKKGKHYCSQISKTPVGGRSSEYITLSLEAFKHMCLMANTDDGEQIRDYFIECEKKWKLLQQTRPDVAEDIEILRWKAEISKNEAIKAQAEQKTVELRHYVATALPKPIGDRILNPNVVKEIEYRDRTIKEDELINDGSTINKTQLCDRYSLATKGGKPDFKKLNGILDKLDLPEDAFDDTMVIRTNKELKREFLPMLDKLFLDSDRQLYLGE